MYFYRPAWEVVMLCKEREVPLELQSKYWCEFFSLTNIQNIFLMTFFISIFAIYTLLFKVYSYQIGHNFGAYHHPLLRHDVAF